MRIAVGCDHAGLTLKNALAEWLIENGHEVIDVGTYGSERVDYPQFGFDVARKVVDGEADRGVAVCGSGQGICMAVNRVPGARGAILRTVDDATITRQHNDANIACFGARTTELHEAIACLGVFLTSEFDGGRHMPRLAQLDTGG